MDQGLKVLLNKAKACVFDFDGTLADTEGFHFDLYQRILGRRYGVTLDWPHWLQYIGRTDPDFHRMMEQDYGIVIDSESVMEEYFAALLAEEPDAVQPYPWAAEKIAFSGVCLLCHRGDLPFCVPLL